ncbi:hypothetical protein J3Q64DRAFT_1693761 [Phycomyces blakesleeanus]|uniref:Uncharacterized protein n=1 Tax=Phycomyces blakesleeanus TaxID=4837 RepID=A0ABR3BES1_PHYBL
MFKVNSASTRSDIVDEPLDLSSSVSIIYPELDFQYYDSNVSIDSDTDEDNTQDYKSDIDKFENMLGDDAYISAEEEDNVAEDNENSPVDIDEVFLLNTILPLSRSFANQLSGGTSETVEEDIHRLKHATSQMEEVENIPDLTNPFKSTLEGLLHAFFYGDEDLCSERMVKKIIYMLKITLKLQETTSQPLVLPAPDRISNFQQRIKSKIPILRPTKCIAKNKKGEEHTFFMNKPSEYLKHLAATPGMVNQMSALPDFTAGQRLHLNQGNKWKYHESLQMPMITFNNQDFWIGDLVKDHQNGHWLINKFMKKSIIYVECFPVIYNDNHNATISDIFIGLNTNFATMTRPYLIPIETITSSIRKELCFQGQGCTAGYDANGKVVLEQHGLTEAISHLWFETYSSNKFKRILPNPSNNTNKYMKVVIMPIILWSDDTSGNKSKQYNVFDSYLMYLAAMPLEVRSQQENTLFICTSDKNLKAVDMLGPIVNDFVKLEIGIEVFSYDHNEYILLVAPLLLLMADNPRHSQLAMHKARYKMLTDTLSFSVNGSEEFLRLNSFDPTTDCPVEVLHTVPLGCIKYLVDYFMKEVLTVAERDRLGNIIMSSRNRDAYSRTFQNNLRHCGSFAGRDYKQLIQVLPTIISKVFLQSTVRINMFSQCFIYLGQLCSLIYLRGIESNYEQYIYVFRDTLSKFTDTLYVLDKHLCQTDAKPPKFSLRPKIHLLHHLLDDVQRFGCPLQYETESAEQFNKFIREHLFMTNRLYTSRDVASRFGKQFICCQIFNGLSFVYKKSWKENDVQKESIVRGESGFKIKNLQADNVDFKKHFFGARMNVTDSYYINKAKIVNGLTGLFSTRNGLFIGKIIINQDGFLTLQKYAFLQANSVSPSWLPGNLTDLHSNPLILPTTTVLVDNSFICKEVMDLGFVFDEERSINIINISEFGTYWSLISNYQYLFTQ